MMPLIPEKLIPLSIKSAKRSISTSLLQQRIQEIIVLIEVGVLRVLGPEPEVREEDGLWLARSKKVPNSTVHVGTLVEPKPNSSRNLAVFKSLFVYIVLWRKDLRVFDVRVSYSISCYFLFLLILVNYIKLYYFGTILTYH
ncbi:hypothetical protein F4782DRAFT_509857 [Xylaria castorea]|nr:hypothetical protein F4782DRAFT_509857 [Xylaria castorea]